MRGVWCCLEHGKGYINIEGQKGGGEVGIKTVGEGRQEGLEGGEGGSILLNIN